MPSSSLLKFFYVDHSPLRFFYVNRLAREVYKIDKLYRRIVGNPYTYIDAPELLTRRELFKDMEELSIELDRCAALTVFDIGFTIKHAKQVREHYENMERIAREGIFVSVDQYFDTDKPVDEIEQGAEAMRSVMHQIITEHRELKNPYEVENHIATDGVVLHHQDMYTRVYQYMSERMIRIFRDDLVLPNPEDYSPEELFKEVHEVIAPQGSLPLIRFLGALDRYDIRPLSFVGPKAQGGSVGA